MSSVKVVKEDYYVNHTSVAEHQHNAFNIYPNPTDGIFTVKGSKIAKVEVYNIVGQKVYAQEGQVVNIDASRWLKGLYMVNILDQNGNVETKKLMLK